MATVFMAHQVQFRSKLAVLVLAVLLFGACGRTVKLKVNSTSPYFQQHEGALFYRGQLFTGTIYQLFYNGDTAKLIPYSDGLQNGLMQWWYANHQLAQRRFFVGGKKEGRHYGWWPDGRLKFDYWFVNDEYQGEVKEWYASGKIFRTFHYNKGHEEGSQKMWWDDGTIRANYVIVNGEKFGLFGQKLCVNDIKN